MAALSQKKRRELGDFLRAHRARLSPASLGLPAIGRRRTSDNGASGVYGQNDSTGYGVAGRANDGTGVFAESTNGTALVVNGNALFSRSGVADAGSSNLCWCQRREFFPSGLPLASRI